jgi:hypothetical protein
VTRVRRSERTAAPPFRAKPTKSSPPASGGHGLARTLAGALLLACAPALACTPALGGDDVRRVEGAQLVVAWRADPAPLKTGEFFAVDAAVCAKTPGSALPSELRIDAVMPEHRHGMNYRPTLKALGNGRFRAEGLLLHMPGLWEFSFDARGGASQEPLKDRVTVR